MREIVWSSNRGEVIVGSEDGTITIWSAKKAAPICKLFNLNLYLSRCNQSS
jgi:WD40 repeat protein